MPDDAADCSQDFSRVIGEGIPADWTKVTGGVFRGTTGAKVDLRDVDIRITSDLTILADGDLTIDGNIELADRPATAGLESLFRQSSPEPNINLISVNGAVIVTKGTSVGHGSASRRGLDSATENGPSDAIAGDAVDAGFIRLRGITIEIAGIVRGVSGGSGGHAVQDRTNDRDVLDSLFDVLNVFQSARADGGRGGRGGDVVLCALEGIVITSDAWVCGGSGGAGGSAKATSENGRPATANGGPSGDGGNVIVNGMRPGCRVMHDGVFLGGTGGRPPTPSAIAVGGNGVVGGNAKARGGDAGAGGTVIFNVNCVLTGRGLVEAGSGSPGGAAEATGGAGGQLSAPPGSVFEGQGGSGGNACAYGGAGGASGDSPEVPVTPSSPPANAKIGANGPGGDATATPGNGGDARPSSTAVGGSSGSAEARGGPNGNGTARRAPVKTGAVRTATASGGIGVPSTQTGVP
jgi:hypothetical protein